MKSPLLDLGDECPSSSNQDDSCTLPWMPLPEEMVRGVRFDLYSESHSFEHHPFEKGVLIRLDDCGYYVYWYSNVKEEVCFLDLATLEDVECCDYCKMYPLLEKSVLTSNSASKHNTHQNFSG
ncbi:hypothetical protein AHF37_09436 [Paragonimus kellicotti]|nr:hypothetical protein AHF37_09436 [Paragonimus kellicotti]